MKTKLMLFSLTILALIVSACGSATPVPPTATSAPVVPVTGPATATPAPVTVSGPAVVDVGQSATLGSFLVDSKGMTLYIFTNDAPNTSNCYGGCATAWPPLLTAGAPTGGTGVTASMLGTTTRTDGTTQVTYNGMPLYYWIKDKIAGDTTGQGVQNVWYVIDPTGTAVTGAPAAASSSGAAVVNMGQNATLGSFLVDSKGMTLYLFTKDTPNTSNCYGGCATAWPPLLTTGAPTPGTGVDDSKLGTTKRTDGTTQVTYNGWPLYYWAKDKVAGDTTGQNVQGVWFVVNRDGEAVTGSPAAASSGGALVNVGQNATLGSFLVDSKGMTLYLFTKDAPNTSNCYGGCATAWPPLLTTGAPTPGTGVDDSKLGTTKRTDGTTQVTYNGWPLYYWKNDKTAGDTTGENVQGVWFVITPDGNQK